jgi:hypothetical protein
MPSASLPPGPLKTSILARAKSQGVLMAKRLPTKLLALKSGCAHDNRWSSPYQAHRVESQKWCRQCKTAAGKTICKPVGKPESLHPKGTTHAPYRLWVSTTLQQKRLPPIPPIEQEWSPASPAGSGIIRKMTDDGIRNGIPQSGNDQDNTQPERRSNPD